MQAVLLEWTNQSLVLVRSFWLMFGALPIVTQYAVTLLFVSGLIAHLFKFTEHTVHDGPSIFTTAGIFFTFVGIAEGLYGFDPQQIDASVPKLLDGLKTAFIASVVGVGIALSIKLRFVLFGLRRRTTQTAKTEGATVTDLYNQMIAVQQALAGGEDSSLLTQIKLGRQDTNDRLDQLRRSQSDFMEKMAENNSKALIEALQKVIADFNVKITEQFGENFKQLNSAVGKLLEWQEGYRNTLTEMIEQQSRTAQNMSLATERYSAVVDKAEIFAKLSESLSTIVGGLNKQQQMLDASLQSLAQLLANASTSLPVIEQKILQLTEQMTFGVKQHQDVISKTLQDGTHGLRTTLAESRTVLLEAVQTANAEVNIRRAFGGISVASRPTTKT